jgi:hypothetical protein
MFKRNPDKGPFIVRGRVRAGSLSMVVTRTDGSTETIVVPAYASIWAYIKHLVGKVVHRG